jgi:hypothetical protein
VTFTELAGRFTGAFRTRAAFGLQPITAPVMIFIPLGMLLGPRMLDVLSETVLGYLDVVVSVALATLGVFIGLALGREGRRAPKLFAAASVEACITIVIVGGAVLFLLGAWQVPLDSPYVLSAVALGLCASASAAPAIGVGDETSVRTAARVADLDDVLPILIGGLVVPAASGQEALLRGFALTALLGLVIGFTGWLLIERAEGEAERGVFVLGLLALAGGASAYLGLSPLLTGMIAGWSWVVAPGRCDLLMTEDLRKVQHPLVVLVLLTAGASLVPSVAGVWLFAPYLVFRLAGKLIGGWTASRLAAGVAPSDLGAYLITPGVIGIAFALNLLQATAGAAGAVVFAVAAGALASELLALFLTPRRAA